MTPVDGALRFARAAYSHVPAGELLAGAASSAAWTLVLSVFLLAPAVARARGE